MNRGRKRSLSKPEIQSAARELILERGLGAFSMRALAARLGHSAAGLYEYFPDKEAILRSLADDAQRLLRGYLESGDDRHGPALYVEEVCLGYIEFARVHPDIFRLLFERFSSRRRALSDPIPRRAPYGVLLAAVWRWAEEVASAPPFPSEAENLQAPPWVEEVAFSLWSLVHGTAELLYGHSHLSGFEDYGSETTRRAVRALLLGWAAMG